MLTGSVLAGCNDEDLAKIRRVGELVGLAFQIKDDILDIYGNEKEIGKPLHSDEKNNKKTYITINGIENQNMILQLCQKKHVILFLSLEMTWKNVILL